MNYTQMVSMNEVLATPKSRAQPKEIKKFKFVKKARKRAVKEVYPSMQQILEEIREKLDESDQFNLDTK